MFSNDWLKKKTKFENNNISFVKNHSCKVAVDILQPIITQVEKYL